jgi:hypothetical protein
MKLTFSSLAYIFLALLIAASDKSEPMTLKPLLASHIDCVAGPVPKSRNFLLYQLTLIR